MNWKFWKKEPGTGLQEGATKLQRPKEIPEPVGRDLIVNLRQDPDWVWSLKSVVRRRQEGKDTYDVRVFDANETVSKKVAVKDFTTFDEHPELILFEGWYNKKTRDVHVEEKGKSQTPAKAA